MRFVPKAFNHEGLSHADRKHPEVQRALRERFRRAIGFSVVSIPPTTIGLILLLWPHTSHRGLIIWAGLALLNCLGHWVGYIRRRSGTSWLWSAVGMQVLGGATWGSLPYLAMPAEPEWQLFVVALIMGVFAANVLFASHFRSTFYGFMIPLALCSVSSFLIYGTGAGRWGAALLVYSAVFSIGLSEISRSSDEAASVFAVRSSELAGGLEAERSRLHEANVKLARQASTDALTQLPNRLAFLHQLDAAIEDGSESSERTVAVAYLDLDDFKRINDSMGHEVGDLLLVAVGERISRCLRDDETVARLGGDELVVLARNLAIDGGAIDLGNRLQACFARSFTLDQRTIDCGCSVGIAVLDKSMTASDIMRFADIALYSAKAQGGESVDLFGREMHVTMENNSLLRKEFVEAFREGQITPYIQPVIDLWTGAIVGGEALARWEHPDGLRSAASFIELATEVGLVDDLNLLVVEQIADLALLIKTATGVEMPIGVNVTFRGLEAVVAQFAASDALDAIVIEVAESASALTAGEVRENVERAREMGVTVLLNDFGTGIASLAVAMELPVDGLKIDHQLISTLYEGSRGASVAAALIELANRLDLEIVAEGIESDRQLEQLRKFGVRFGQGFLFAPAVPIATFHEWVVSNKTFPVAAESTIVT